MKHRAAAAVITGWTEALDMLMNDNKMSHELAVELTTLAADRTRDAVKRPDLPNDDESFDHLLLWSPLPETEPKGYNE